MLQNTHMYNLQSCIHMPPSHPTLHTSHLYSVIYTWMQTQLQISASMQQTTHFHRVASNFKVYCSICLLCKWGLLVCLPNAEWYNEAHMPHYMPNNMPGSMPCRLIYDIMVRPRQVNMSWQLVCSNQSYILQINAIFQKYTTHPSNATYIWNDIM